MKDPFQDITLSDQEEANDEVHVTNNDEDGDDDVDVQSGNELAKRHVLVFFDKSYIIETNPES